MSKFFRAFEVKYLGPTNCRGSRVKITDMHNPCDVVVIPFDYTYNNAWETAEHYLKTERGIVCEHRAGNSDVDWLLSSNFETELVAPN